MKTIFYLILVFIIVLTIKASGQGIIIDHNCVNVEQIPENYIDSVKTGIRFQWAHQSHGGQIPCGLEVLENLYPQFDAEVGYMILPTVQGAMNVYDGNQGFDQPGQCCTSITPEGYWVPPTGPEWTNDCLTYNPTLNVSGFLWCYQLEEYNAAYVQDYLNQMEIFEATYPNVTFVYTTANAQAYGDAGLTRHANNEIIRSYCIAHNKVLFDFGDIDCWYNGVQNTTTFNGVTYPVQSTAFDGQECGHVNLLGAEYKARAIWWMMARIRGWQPNARSLNIKVYLQGSYTPSGMMTTLNSQGLLPLSQPFNFPPLNYNGNESVSSIPNANVVDWVLIELRDAVNAQSATSNTVVERKAAFVLNNGQIVDLDGASFVPFTQTINQQLFLVLRHRSHLGIMSSSPLSANNNIYQYDFTTGSTKSYGGINSQKELELGIWGMIGGDGYLDGVINNTDKTLTWKPDSGEKGYNPGDFNLNGNINNQDKNLIWITNFGKTSYIP
jgi:hypothetical protein